MIVNETMTLVLAGLAGLILGAIFFGGLWWTVRKGLTAKQPALWFLGSMIVRMSIVLTGFYFVGGGSWQRLLICLLGFIGARIIVVSLTRPQKPEAFANQPKRVSVDSSVASGECSAKSGANALRLMEPGTVRLGKESGHAT